MCVPSCKYCHLLFEDELIGLNTYLRYSTNSLVVHAIVEVLHIQDRNLM
jgi:hypothetical protein